MSDQKSKGPPLGAPSPWKPALLAFSFVLMSALLFLKPHLPKALFYNFANIDDYTIFVNRVVPIDRAGMPWPRGDAKLVVPEFSLPDSLEKILLETQTTALVVIKDRQIIFERYSRDGAADKISGSFSMAKTIVALLLGMAIDEGLIPSIQTPISKYLTEWASRPEGAITFEQLLHMSSGLNWDETYVNPLSVTTEGYYGDNLYQTALKQRLVTESGKYYSFQSGDTQLLAMALSRAVKRSLSVYASEKLWKPLQAETEALWSMDHDEGLEKAFCCFNATARDFARLGQLVLDRGKWKGQVVVSEGWIESMVTAHQLPKKNGDQTDYYGKHIWIQKTAAGPVPHFQGILGQYIDIVPSQNAVVVRLGHKRGKKIGHTYAENVALIDWAVSGFKSKY